jgi:tRNA(Arg) A34 adenosine deaminase TadA
MKSHEEYMNIAIEVANEAKMKGGVAIGAVLVDTISGSIVSTGASMVAVAHDPTAHAEINAIRKAAEFLKTDDLFNFTLYSTLEPCHMCLSAAAWARIPRLLFGAYRKDVDETLFDIKGDFSDEKEGDRMNLRENIGMKVVGGVLEDDCAKLLKSHHESPHHDEQLA